MPMKRIWPSVILSARSKTLRQAAGLNKGSSPSATNISANAPSIASHTPAPLSARYLFAPTGAAGPRIARKNSLLLSTIMMSDLLRKLAR